MSTPDETADHELEAQELADDEMAAVSGGNGGIDTQLFSNTEAEAEGAPALGLVRRTLF